ncbi:MAG: hypothetical protein MHPSP_004652, partial [Paramarteilia canceri]
TDINFHEQYIDLFKENLLKVDNKISEWTQETKIIACIAILKIADISNEIRPFNVFFESYCKLLREFEKQ